jgi:hypothetical protein
MRIDSLGQFFIYRRQHKLKAAPRLLSAKLTFQAAAAETIKPA